MNSIHWNMPDAEYRSALGVSNSQLKHMKESPAHFQYALTHPRKMTDALRFGLLVDHLFFTPEAPEWWALVPEGLNLSTKAGIEWKKNNEGDVAPHCRVHWEEKHCAEKLVNALREHPDAIRALGTGKPQVSVFWEHVTTGGLVVRRKMRCDWASGGDSIVDLKTTEDAKKTAFEKSIFEFGYHRQAAAYLDGWNAAALDHGVTKKSNFVLVAAEKEPPHGIRVYYLTPEAIQAGREENNRLLNLFAECTASNDWPNYPTGIEPIGLPAWAYQKTEWIT
jgi:hypothetical protein